MTVNILTPTLGESVTEATITKWRKKVGDFVNIDEILLELETDKVTLEVTASTAGRLEKITAQDGATVIIKQLLGEIDETAVNVEGAATSTANTSAVAMPNSVTTKNAIASPAAQKISLDRGIDLNSLEGTGKDGRITKSDVLSATHNVINDTNEISNPIALERRVKMSRLRKTIATRLKESQNTAAILTTFNEIDMFNVMHARQVYQDKFQKKHGVKLGFMSFFAKAAVQALKEIPAINAEICGDDIIYKDYYDIGIAVGTESGLVVPVLRNVDSLSFADIEKNIAALGTKAKDGKLSMDDLTGGTFSITNGGIYGSMLSTPIINPPQSGILGMHNIVERPCVVKGEIVARPIMYVALSYDHRIIDGKEAVIFLVRIKEMLENPERLLLDI